MRNSLSELKQANFDLVEYVEQEKVHLDDFRDSACLSIQ